MHVKSAVNNQTRYALSTILMVVIAFVVVQILIRTGNISSLIKGQLVPICAYIVLAISLNLTVGILGELSLGHAGFMSVGTFTAATVCALTKASIPSSGVRLLLAIILGGIMAGIVGILIGIPVLRLKSDYLAIATLGFAEIIRALLAAPMMDRITNGSYGLNNIPGFKNLFQPVLIAAVCIIVMIMLINSSFGRAFKAIREDEVAAEAMGINLFTHKELSFVISSFFTGISGGMLAVFMRSIDTKTFQVTLTYNILLIVVLGGIGSVSGSIIGSLLINGGQEWLRFLDEPHAIAGYSIPLFRPGLRMVIYSILLMVVVLFWRSGIMGTNEFSWKWFFGLFRRGKRKNVQTGGDQ